MRQHPLTLLSVLVLVLVAASMLPTSYSYIQNRIERDFLALTRKVTARHILLPKSRVVALKLKQTIRNKVSPHRDSDRPARYIVDIFSAAAKKFSRDDETAANGGLIATLAPQGYCRFKQLDEACFEAPLGELWGPVESDYGYHLLLVEERINCEKIDGRYNRIVRGVDGTSKVFVEDACREGDEQKMTRLVTQHMGFWTGVSMAGVAGGMLTEVAGNAANAIDPLVAASAANAVDMGMADPMVAAVAANADMGMTAFI